VRSYRGDAGSAEDQEEEVMDVKKLYCPLEIASSKTDGQPCVESLCAWWVENMSACAMVAVCNLLCAIYGGIPEGAK